MYANKLLIAHPGCPKDSPFHKSVIYIYQHQPGNGTVGVIINKPSKYTVQEVCADKQIVFLNNRDLIFHGGPVNPNALILLHSEGWRSENTMTAGNGLCITSDNKMLEKIAAGNEPEQWRLFGGMSGWADGQLAHEMSGKWPYRTENSWLICSATLEFIFKIPIKQQWAAACEMAGKQMFEEYF